MVQTATLREYLTKFTLEKVYHSRNRAYLVESKNGWSCSTASLNVIMNRHKVIANLIQLSVPVLNLFRTPDAWPYPFENLAQFEDETLGRELYNFLSIRNLGYLPKYEEHDSYHVLLGYGTTVTEELKLQAFMWGNKNSTFAGKVLFIIGWIVFPSKHSLFRREIIRGKSAKALSNIPVASMIPKNLSELRRDFCIS